MLSPEGILDALEAAGVLSWSKKRVEITVDATADDTDHEVEFVFDESTVGVSVNSGTGATPSGVATQFADEINSALSEFMEASAAGDVCTVDAVGVGTEPGPPEIPWGFSTADPNLTAVESELVDSDTRDEVRDKALPLWEQVVGGVRTDTIAGDQNNYSLSSGSGAEYAAATMLRVDGGLADRNITGLQVAIGGTNPVFRRVALVNVGATNSLVLVNASGLSSERNRFAFSAATNRTLAPDGMIMLVYDPLSERWRTDS